MMRLVLVLLLAASSAGAVNPNERLGDPAQEARAREVSKALRCVVCQNETIDESSAELAKDMRLLVRERIAAGDSNEQVVNYMVQRYGDFVLLKPRFTAETLALWLGPALLLGIGALMAARRLRRAGAQAGVTQAAAGLSAEESAELNKLMAKTNKDQRS
ncbi:MAG: cytochrome c-type biogenesis protein [Rhodospirillaceae bacterium]|nr:cytochrome c-type biogenesis protein [Rhodospirillaceae bacterium]